MEIYFVPTPYGGATRSRLLNEGAALVTNVISTRVDKNSKVDGFKKAHPSMSGHDLGALGITPVFTTGIPAQGLFVGILAEFGEDSDGALRMQECDVEAVSTFAGSGINEADSLLIALGKRTCHAVFNAEGHMVYALVALVEPFLDGALGACGLEEFQLDLTDLEEGSLNFLILDHFGLVTFQSKDIFEIRQHLINTLYSNAQVLNL